MIDRPFQIAGALVIAAAIGWGSVMLDRAVTGRVETVTTTDTITVERAAEESDLFEAAIPDWITEYEAPDSSDTVRDCFQVPTWMLPKPDTDTGGTGVPMQSRRDSMDLRLSTSYMPRSGPGYGIIPMTSGRPKVSVGRRRVEVPVFDRHGALTEYTYEVPSPNWRVPLSLDAFAAPIGFAMVTANLEAQHRTALGWVGVGAGYGVVLTSETQRSGWGVSVSFESTLWSR